MKVDVFIGCLSLYLSVFLIKTKTQNLLKLGWIVSRQESYTSVLFLLIVTPFIKSAKLVSCHARGGCALIIIILPCKNIHRPWTFPHFCQISYKLRCSRRERCRYWHRSPDYKCTPYFFKFCFCKMLAALYPFSSQSRRKTEYLTVCSETLKKFVNCNGEWIVFLDVYLFCFDKVKKT